MDRAEARCRTSARLAYESRLDLKPASPRLQWGAWQIGCKLGFASPTFARSPRAALRQARSIAICRQHCLKVHRMGGSFRRSCQPTGIKSHVRPIRHLRLRHHWRRHGRLFAGQPPKRGAKPTCLTARSGQGRQLPVDSHPGGLSLLHWQSAHRLAVSHRTGRGA